jgi:hypothetical protein
MMDSCAPLNNDCRLVNKRDTHLLVVFDGHVVPRHYRWCYHPKFFTAFSNGVVACTPPQEADRRGGYR